MTGIVYSAACDPGAALPELIAAAVASGCGSVELFRHRTTSSVDQSDWSVTGIRKALATAGITLGNYEIRPLTGRKGDSDERNRAYNLRQLEWDVHLGRALGIRHVVVRGGARNGEAREDLIAGLGELVERIPDVVFCLAPEVDTPLEVANDFTELRAELPDSVRWALDTASLLGAGEDVAAVLEAEIDRAHVVRVGDVNDVGDGVALGTGALPLDAVKALLAGFDGVIVAESACGTGVSAIFADVGADQPAAQ
ncbi:MAG: TIM barrel protein [Candidatus Latescibacterota bacterium]|nr:TIM barrel protein [Candidatus Latescibacterota bacterium]